MLVVASELERAGMPTRPVDLDLLGETDELRSQRIQEIIQEENPSRIYLSLQGLLGIARFSYLLDIERIRSENPGIALIAGGPLATVDQTYVERFLAPDHTVIGHLETATVSGLIAGMRAGNQTIRLGSPGSGSRTGSGSRSRDYSYHIDTRLYSNLIDQSISEVGADHLTIYMETMRSCPFR